MTNETKLVTLPKEVAEAIGKLKETERWPMSDLMDSSNFINESGYVAPDSDQAAYPIAVYLMEHFENNLPTYMEALVKGYQVEMSPEEKVAEYYESLFGENQFDKKEFVLVKTLNLLGVSIQGVNVR